MSSPELPPAWVRDAVFYQVFPDRFARSPRDGMAGPFEPWDAAPTVTGFKGGSLAGIVDHLEELADLGITALYLNPIFRSAANHRYHTDDYLSVDPILGGDAGLHALLDACHARGMRVILDGVFNHCGRGFWPFHHVAENGLASPYRDWFFLDHEGLAAGRPLNPYPEGAIRTGGWPGPGDHGIPARQRLGYDAWWGLSALPKLNTDHPAVREYLFGVAEHWLRFGIDGWRLDVPEEIADDGFWWEFRRRVRAAQPEAYVVAEIWSDRPWRLDGAQFDGFMNYPLGEAILSFVGSSSLDMRVVNQQMNLARSVRPEDAPAFAGRLDHLLGRFAPATTTAQLTLMGSHDTPRVRSLLGGDQGAVTLAFLALLTLPGAPCIYYGDEIGLEGEMDPDCRRAFPWDRRRWDQRLRGDVAAIIGLRHRLPALRSARTRILAAVGGTCVYLRLPDEPGDASEGCLVAINAGRDAARVTVGVPELEVRALRTAWMGASGAAAHRLGSDEASAGTSLVLDLPAREGVVLAAPVERSARLG